MAVGSPAAYDAGSSLLMSSYGDEAASISDSRFNDISCISYADRTIDEKDRIDVSRETIAAENNSSRLSYNNTSSSKKRESTDMSKYNSSCGVNSDTTLEEIGAAASKRKFKTAFGSNTSLMQSMSTKRMRRDSMRAATDGIEATNPTPLAIPIASERALPPDRRRHDGALTSSLAHAEKSSARAGSSSDFNSVLTNTENNSKTEKQRDTTNANTALVDENLDSASRGAIDISSPSNESKLSHYLRLANSCAKRLNSKCVSESFSRSYNEESLRFTC